MTIPAATPADLIEQQDARFAIDGAIAYGRMGTNEPPAGHWLTEYWHIGRQLAKLGETSAWDSQTPLATTSPAVVTKADELGFRIKDAIAGIANCVADPMWAEHAEVSKFNLKRWHKVLHDMARALATPSPGKADAERPYWYCCGSTDPAHADHRAKGCHGAPQWFHHFAPQSEHSKRDIESYIATERDKQ